jgi:hypothetical protein
MSTIHTDGLDEYTETSATINEQATIHLRNILAGRAYEDRLTQAELTRRVSNALASRGVPDEEHPSTSTIRSLIRRVRREYNLPVYSKGSGYWCVQGIDEFEAAIDRIDSQIETKRETKRELASAFNQGGSR